MWKDILVAREDSWVGYEIVYFILFCMWQIPTKKKMFKIFHIIRIKENYSDNSLSWNDVCICVSLSHSFSANFVFTCSLPIIATDIIMVTIMKNIFIYLKITDCEYVCYAK